MTQFEKERLYPEAKKILELLGYNTEEDVYSQFMQRHEKKMRKKPSKPFHPNYIKYKKISK